MKTKNTQKNMRINSKKRSSSAQRCRGPKNPQDARYVRTEKKIRRVLRKALRGRRINVRTFEMCQEAGITLPTFHRHCRDCDEALRGYEEVMLDDFRGLVGRMKVRTRRKIFLVLLEFVRREQGYFAATMMRGDFWLLLQLLKELRPLLTGGGVNDRIYETYVAALIGPLFCWGRHEGFSRGTMGKCAVRLMKVRMMNYWA